jgi:hypothetical protein
LTYSSHPVMPKRYSSQHDHGCRILGNTFRNSKILEVLREASILRVFLRNTRRLVIFFYQLLQESFLLKNHKNIPSFEFLFFGAKL